MLPDKKKMLKLWALGIVLLILVIFGIYSLTKYIKSDKTVLFVSDPYPDEYVYMAVQYNEKSGYEVITPLRSDFTKLDKSVNSFFKINDMKVIDEKLVIYSDAVNEVAYDNKDDRLFLSEVNSFYDTSVDVYLAQDYLVYVTKENSIYYRKYNLKTEEESTLLVSNLTNKNIKINGNIVYYRDFEGIVAYDLDAKTVQTLVPTDDNFSPYIEGGNENYLLLRNGTTLFIYELKNGKTSYINEKVNKKEYKYLNLYDYGFLYARLNPYSVVAYSLFYDKLEYAPYTFDEGLTVSNSFCFDESKCYLDFVNVANEHTYMIFDFKVDKKLATLDEAYEMIVKVKV